MGTHVGVISLSSCIPSLPPQRRLYCNRGKLFAMASMSEDPIREWILSEGKATQITRISSIGGGCINLANRYDTDAGSFFVKTNRSIGASMFEGEALGLNAMYETSSIRVPKPFKFGDLPTGGSYIIMEFIEFGFSRGDQSILGRMLAEMHKAGKSEKGFGFDVDNTIGSTPQINTWTSDWVEFYGQHRLGYQLKLARQQYGDSTIYERGQRLVKNMGPLFENIVIEPCLLHGDLWSGNVSSDKNGEPVILDPACYYGHNEAEFGMSCGKRPRDLLNPKAVKYMQSVFSIKDAISKRESREISALFGVTVTQVREFFTSQRSRVRRFVRLSREKVARSNACNEKQDELQTNPTNSDSMLPINLVPLDSVGPTSIEEGPSCSPPDESLPGMDELDKHFLDNIFSLMRKEESFSGQVKLMEWILQRKNSALLMWFLTKGGVMILATWLSQAAIEEQTSVLHVILKVLCHLPLHKALPAHMSAILQSVNKLRFYRASDISNRARILLSRWSKLFARTQAMKKPSAVKSSNDAQNEMLLKQSIGEIMEADSWDSKIGINEESLVSPYECSENFRKLDSQQPLKLLPASTDDSNKKLIRGVSASQTRERRKVLLVEQPGQRTGGRSVQVAKSVPANQGRPLSADDIQKAKMRAQFMQSKYGKPSTSTNEGLQTKTEGSNKSSSSQASTWISPPKSPVRPNIESQASMWISPPKSPVRPNIEEHKKYVTSPLDNKIRDPEEPLWKKCKRVQIRWLTPPEVRINGDWSVGTGDNSKEVEVQKNRIRREKEIIYKTVLEISSDPKEPWDREMDYDDSLTPEIPIEQLPDGDANVGAVETSVSSGENGSTGDIPATTSSQNGEMSEMPEPDLELLAVLLKNPDLVFALTAGQSVGLSSEDTVKLLDMIKTNGVNSAMGDNLNGGLGGKADENKVEVSLPSPTPSSNPVTSGWGPDVDKNPFSRHMTAQEKLPLKSSVQSQISYSYSDTLVPQQPQTVTLSMTHQTMPPFPPVITSLPQYATPPNFQTPTSEILAMKRFSAPSHNLPGLAMSRTPERTPVAFSTPQLTPTLTRIQPQPRPSLVPEPLLPTMNSWRARQGLSSNPHSQASQNNFNASFGGPVQPGPHWERDEYLGQPEFETWSPDRNSIRSPEYMPGRNYMEPRMNMGHNYRPDRSRPRGFSGNRDQNRFDNRRWRERDRRR